MGKLVCLETVSECASIQNGGGLWCRNEAPCVVLFRTSPNLVSVGGNVLAAIMSTNTY